MKKATEIIVRWFEEHGGFSLYALVLFLVMAGAYLSLVGRMGFNYDDWEGIFLYRQGFSPSQVWDYFLVDRPFSALVHWVFHPILGTSVESWHLLTVLLHWGAILLLVRSLLMLFPGQVLPIGWIGFLLALYPGLTRHFVARTSSPHYVSMFLFCLSLWLMFRAIQSERLRGWLLSISVILSLAQVLIIEYFASLEVARFFLLLFYFTRQNVGTFWQALRRSFLDWAPYFLVFVAFLAFKFQILPEIALEEGLQAKHPVDVMQSLVVAPMATILEYANLIAQDVLHAVLYVWSLPLVPADVDIASTSFLCSWILGLLFAFVAGWTIYAWVKRIPQPQDDSAPAWQLPGLALVVMLLGGLPSWIIGRQAVVGLWSSRFLLAPVLGAVPLVVLLVMGLTGSQRWKAANFFLAALLATSFSYQFREANRYTLYWRYQYDYYWQLKWRAPGLVPQTFILAPNTPLIRNSHYQIAFVTNLVYAPGRSSSEALYWWFDGPDSLRNFQSGEYQPGSSVQASMRTVTFSSNMEYALPVLSRPSRGCVQVLTDAYYQGEPGLSEEDNQLFDLAHDGLILAEGAHMPLDIFGPEPEHGWCYFYQKAEFSRDFGDWDEILRLWREADVLGLRAKYGPEYLPFIESLARAGEWDEATELTNLAGKTTKEGRPFLCSFWKDHLSQFPGYTDWWPDAAGHLLCR